MKTIKTLCAALVLCLILALAKDQLEPRLLANANYGLPALAKQSGTEMLFLGSSMFRQGIDIDVLEQTKKDWYILSYNGLQPVTEELLLRRLTDAGVEIGTLFVDMYAYSACAEPSLADEKMFMELDLAGKWKLWGLISRTESPAAFWRLFVTGNNELLLTWPLYSPLVNRRFHNGGRTVYTEGMTAEQMAAPPELSGTLHEEQQKALRALIANAQEHGIHVVFLETPKFRTVMEDERYIQAMGQYQTLLDEEGVEYLLVKDICPETCLVPENFSDAVHMSSQGRAAYTRVLAKLLEWQNTESSNISYR